ncbi:MAG: S1 family peptidase [Cellvibrionaceae bacterium]|nr:S1 family peptidase [Cellvibrionaceae bacterium]
MTTVVSTHNPSAAGDGLTKYVVAKKPPVRFPLKNLLVLASLSPPLVTGGSASLRDPVARHLLSGPSSRAAQPGDYPSVAFLSMEPLDSKSAYRRGCTGTLIAKNNTGGLGVFATAGHCGHPQAVTLNNTHPNDPMAQQRQEGRQWQTVLPGTSQFHPDYAGSNGHQGVDIALHYTLPFTGIDPVRVYRGKLPEVGDTLWSAGFGYAYRVGERPTPRCIKNICVPAPSRCSAIAATPMDLKSILWLSTRMMWRWSRVTPVPVSMLRTRRAQVITTG